MKRALLLLSTALVMGTTFGSHIIGGHLTLTHISGMDYELKGVVWRDCINGIPSLPSSLPVTQYINVSPYSIQTSYSVPMITSSIKTLGDECYTPTGLCVEEGVYSMTITLTSNPNGYYFTWSDCCRNNIIDNLNDPDSEGMTFVLETPDPAAMVNSSPDFGLYPQTGYFCANTTNTIDESLIDPDGDSLVYYLSEPLSDDPLKPFTPVVWGAGFSLGDIVGGVPPMTMDPVTGVITCSPDIIGNVYVFAITVEEWRGGVKIGEIRRDLQYMVLACTFDAPPGLFTTDSDTLTVPLGQEFCFDIAVVDDDYGDTLAISVVSQETFDLGGQITLDPSNTYDYFEPGVGWQTMTTSGNTIYDSINNFYVDTGSVGLEYCWQTECGDELVSAPYEVDIYAFSIGCSGYSDTLTKTMYLDVQPIQDGYEYTPNVFSPNGDGFNDVFTIVGLPDECYDDIKLEIYNRWGQLVFEDEILPETGDIIEWDGKNQGGNAVAEGTYFLWIKGQYGGVEVEENFAVTVLY